MTNSDHGTEELRVRGNRAEVAAENAVGGLTCIVDRWHTYADFLRDLNLITQDHHDAFSEFLELWYAAHGKNAPSGNGKGEKYQEWIIFGARLGPANLRILEEIRESESPSSTYQCSAAIDAAVKTQKVASQMGQHILAAHVAKEIERLRSLLKMREAIIRSHRFSARIRAKAFHDAMDSAREVFEFILEQKKLDEKRKSEL